MSKRQYGAVVYGRRSGADAASTVEARVLDGARVVMIAAVHGDLATPSLEGLKSALTKIKTVDAAAATTLTLSAPPPPYAEGVAVVLLFGARAFVATSGSGRCYCERAGVLAELAAGAHDLLVGDAMIAIGHGELDSGRAFFSANVADADAHEDADAFANNALDEALDTAMANHAGFVGIAAARVAS